MLRTDMYLFKVRSRLNSPTWKFVSLPSTGMVASRLRATGMVVASRLLRHREALVRSSLRLGSTPRRLLSSEPPAEPKAGGILRRTWTQYVHALESDPLKVKVASAAVIFSTGDLTAQTLVDRTAPRSIDLGRLARMVAFGCLVTAWVHGWWGTLEPLAASVFCPQAQRLKNTVFKVACDQTFGAGSFNLIFFTQTSLMEGCSANDTLDRVRAQWWPQMQRHWCFWPWFHLGNFYHNPLHLRVLWQNLAQIGWSALLSSVSAGAGAGPASRANVENYINSGRSSETRQHTCRHSRASVP